MPLTPALQEGRGRKGEDLHLSWKRKNAFRSLWDQCPSCGLFSSITPDRFMTIMGGTKLQLPGRGASVHRAYVCYSPALNNTGNTRDNPCTLYLALVPARRPPHTLADRRHRGAHLPHFPARMLCLLKRIPPPIRLPHIGATMAARF